MFDNALAFRKTAAQACLSKEALQNRYGKIRDGLTLWKLQFCGILLALSIAHVSGRQLQREALLVVTAMRRFISKKRPSDISLSGTLILADQPGALTATLEFAARTASRLDTSSDIECESGQRSRNCATLAVWSNAVGSSILYAKQPQRYAVLAVAVNKPIQHNQVWVCFAAQTAPRVPHRRRGSKRK